MVVTMSFCIFIASSTATTSPSFTSSPALTGILTIKPCIGAITVPSPDFGGDGALAAAADAPAAEVTDMPAPVTRTLNTSPSTSTSNSAVETGAGGEGSDACTWAGAAAGVAVATGSGSGFSDAFGGGPLRYSWARLGNMR